MEDKVFTKTQYHMKCIFNCFAVFAIMAGSFCSCSDYVQKDQFESLEQRVSTLENLVKDANSNISTLESAVSVLQGKVSVADVSETADGYVIRFSDGKTATIKNGKDGGSPVIGIKKDDDGKYYWTLDGEWLLSGGQKIVAGASDGATPLLRIVDGRWQVSTDNGKTWSDVATSGEYVIFKSVDCSDPTFVYFTLQDGTVLKLSRGASGVQSIVAVPEYSDGSVKVVSNGESKLKFDVFPAGAGEAVAALAPDKFEVKVVYTETKASAGDRTSLPVTSVEYTDGVLVVAVDASSLDGSFFSKNMAASALLAINDGIISSNSEYFPLFGVKTSASGKLLLEVTEPPFLNLPGNNVEMDFPEEMYFDPSLPEMESKRYSDSDNEVLKIFTDYTEDLLGIKIDERWEVYVHFYDSAHTTGAVRFRYFIGDIGTNKAIAFNLMEGCVNMIFWADMGMRTDEDALKNRIVLFNEKYEQGSYQPKAGETIGHTTTSYDYHYSYDLLLYTYAVHIIDERGTGGDDYATTCFIDKDGNAIFEIPDGISEY